MGIFNDHILEASKAANRADKLLNSLAKVCRDTVADLDSHSKWPTNVSLRWRELVVDIPDNIPANPRRMAIALLSANGEELVRCFAVTCDNNEHPRDSKAFVATGYLVHARDFELLHGLLVEDPTRNTHNVTKWYVGVFKDPYTMALALLKDLSEKAAIPLKYPEPGDSDEGYF